jgi:hypothetical protein
MVTIFQRFCYVCTLVFASLSTNAYGEIINFSITGGSLVLSGRVATTAFGQFDYAQQAAGSLTTTYTGSFAVDVNNILAPTAITFNNAVVDANVSGTWAPGNDGSNTASGPADYGISVPAIGGLGKLRDIVFNVSSAAIPINGAGNFSVSSQNWRHTTGNFDVFAPALGSGSDPIPSTIVSSNTSSTLGSYTVSGQTITMTVPVIISFNIPIDTGVDAVNTYTGTLTAIAAVPEPSSILLIFAGGSIAGARILRRRAVSK